MNINLSQSEKHTIAYRYLKELRNAKDTLNDEQKQLFDLTLEILKEVRE